MPGRHSLLLAEDWHRWQHEPLLGAKEQQPAVLASRQAALSGAAASGTADICIVSTATGAYGNAGTSGIKLLENKRAFCEACGYRCLIDTRGVFSTGRPSKWDKLLVLHDALRICNTTLYVDADVVFRRAFQIRPLTRSWLTGSKDFVGLNSGVLLLVRARRAREFLSAAWQHQFFNRSFNADQNAVRLELRRPFAEKREKKDRVTVFENLVSYMFYGGAFAEQVEADTNFSAPLFHSAGCTVTAPGNTTELRIKHCQDLLMRRLPPRSAFDSCPSIERRYKVRNGIFNRHTQRGGATNLGRRWLIGRDLRIRYTDQKGTNKTGRWWERHPGCGEFGCADAEAKASRGGSPR